MYVNLSMLCACVCVCVRACVRARGVHVRGEIVT
jgi:hypothetical protein